MTTKLERYWHSDEWGWCYRLVLYVRGVEVLAHYNVRPEAVAFWDAKLRSQWETMR